MRKTSGRCVSTQLNLQNVARPNLDPDVQKFVDEFHAENARVMGEMDFHPDYGAIERRFARIAGAAERRSKHRRKS